MIVNTLVVGCSHKGIVNIVHQCYNDKKILPDIEADGGVSAIKVYLGRKPGIYFHRESD